LFELNRTDYERVRPLFRKMDIHLPLQAILAGNVSAIIYVDNPLHPQTALTWTGHRFYLAGSPGNTDLIAAVRKIFFENFAMSAWKTGIESYVLYYPTEKWEVFVKAMLEKKFPIKAERSYFAYKASRANLQKPPDGYSIRSVDSAFLSEKWQNQESLTEEMCSERVSVTDFLAKSFGVCLIKGNAIMGWCLSEYNTGHRCEIGIAVDEDIREEGFGTLLTQSFIEMARTKDVARIGWHCAASNIASGATALKAGFEKIEDFPVFFGWFDDATNIAHNGYSAHGRGEYAEALAFYEKAMSFGDVPDRVYWGAACDAALIGETGKSLRYLGSAIEHGFDNLEEIKNSRYLISLHETAGWQEVLKRLTK
jgi:RimJ/RimL family protein N-acetyltransferase